MKILIYHQLSLSVVKKLFLQFFQRFERYVLSGQPLKCIADGVAGAAESLKQPAEHGFSSSRGNDP